MTSSCHRAMKHACKICAIFLVSIYSFVVHGKAPIIPFSFLNFVLGHSKCKRLLPTPGVSHATGKWRCADVGASLFIFCDNKPTLRLKMMSFIMHATPSKLAIFLFFLFRG